VVEGFLRSGLPDRGAEAAEDVVGLEAALRQALEVDDLDFQLGMGLADLAPRPDDNTRVARRGEQALEEEGTDEPGRADQQCSARAGDRLDIATGTVPI
jgi:hypothetical protein